MLAVDVMAAGSIEQADDLEKAVGVQKSRKIAEMPRDQKVISGRDEGFFQLMVHLKIHMEAPRDLLADLRFMLYLDQIGLLWSEAAFRLSLQIIFNFKIQVICPTGGIHRAGIVAALLICFHDSSSANLFQLYGCNPKSQFYAVYCNKTEILD